MRISAKSEYACLALVELAGPGPEGTPLRIRQIADAQNIPESYLVQILHQLKAAGLVQSVRGTIGGYRLTRSGRDISVADVIAAVEGPGEPSREPASAAARNLVLLLKQAHAARWDVLAATSIGQLAIASDIRDDYVL